MRHVRLIFALTVSSLLISCNDGPSPIGSNFFQDTNLDVIYIDTLTLKVSTVKFDSMVTSDAQHFLVGYHDDPELGKVSSKAFFQIAPGGALGLEEDFTSYSHTTLVLPYGGYSYYDTGALVKLNIHELTQDMELDEGYLFNTTSFSYDPTPLGSFTFLPKPNRSDTLEIPLSNAFGQNIIHLAQRSSEEVSSISAFLKYFKGLAIVPDMSSSAAILGFSTGAQVRVYYFDKSETPTAEKYIVLSGGSNLKFNQVRSDRSATALSALTTKRYPLSSSLTHESAYIQSGEGLALRVEIPYLKELLSSSVNLIVSDAVLEIVPVRELANKNTPLPLNLIMSAVNYKNDVYGTFENKADLKEDVYLGRDTHYEANITSFVLQQLAVQEFNKNALLFAVNDLGFRSTVDRLQVGDQHSEYKMKLKMYCLTIKN